MISSLLRLFCAHIVGDYMLQPDALCRRRLLPGWKGYQAIIIHGLIQAAVAYAFVGAWSCWLLPLWVFVVHSAIDTVKIRFSGNSLKAFILDQLAHFVSLVLIWGLLFDPSIFSKILGWGAVSNHTWALIIAFLLVFEPTSILLGLFLKKWVPTDTTEKGLPSGGKWIGYLERLLIVIFVVTNNIVGVGFLLAAKSIFRFGELSRPKEVRTTEYVLIGTFSSFTIAIVLSYITFLF